MRTRAALWAVAIGTGAIALSGCGSSPSSSSTSTTAVAPAAALSTGAYAPAGSSGTPHYVVDISSADGTAFTGTMTFVYQDGRTSRAFEFSGKVMGDTATATPTNVASGSATKTVSSPPSSLHIAVGPSVLTFEDCQTYLPEAQSSSACAFDQAH